MIKSAFIKQVLNGTALLTAGTVISKGLLFIASLLLVRFFTKSEYGEFGIIKSTIDNFLIFASAGIGLTTTKFVSELSRDNEDQIRSVIKSSIFIISIISLAVVSFVFIFSDFIVNDFLNNKDLLYPFLIGIVSLVFLAINSAQIGAILGLQAYKENSIVLILQGCFIFIGYVLGGFFYGVTGAIAGYSLSLLILLILTNVIMNKILRAREIKKSKWTLKTDFRKIIKFAIPASLSSMISAPVMWLVYAMLANSQNGYVKLGFFTTILIFSSSIQMINSSLNNALLPILLRTNDFSLKKDFFNYFGTWFITIILAIPLLLFPEIISFAISDKYDPNQFIPLLLVTFFAAFIVSNKTGVSRDLIVKNKMWLSVFSVGQSSLLTYFLFKFFFYEFGALGLGISITSSLIFNYLIFIPCYIKLGISKSYIFYNFWILLIWMCLTTFIVLVYYFYDVSIVLRCFLFILFFSLITFLFFKMYHKLLKLKPINFST